MNAPEAVSVPSRSEQETEDLGARLAAALPPGTVLAMVGPLGAGKTAFARGVARGLGIDPDEVSSPTFTYLVDYPEGRVPFVHADLYRLGDLPENLAASALDSIGLVEAIERRDSVVLVEWWPWYRGPEPGRLVRVEIAREPGDGRTILLNFRGPGLDDARRKVLA